MDVDVRWLCYMLMLCRRRDRTLPCPFCCSDVASNFSSIPRPNSFVRPAFKWAGGLKGRIQTRGWCNRSRAARLGNRRHGLMMTFDCSWSFHGARMVQIIGLPRWSSHCSRRSSSSWGRPTAPEHWSATPWNEHVCCQRWTETAWHRNDVTQHFEVKSQDRFSELHCAEPSVLGQYTPDPLLFELFLPDFARCSPRVSALTFWSTVSQRLWRSLQRSLVAEVYQNLANIGHRCHFLGSTCECRQMRNVWTNVGVTSAFLEHCRCGAGGAPGCWEHDWGWSWPWSWLCCRWMTLSPEVSRLALKSEISAYFGQIFGLVNMEMLRPWCVLSLTCAWPVWSCLCFRLRTSKNYVFT